VKRYNVKCYGYAKVVESDNGQWVTSEDAKECCKQLEAAEKRIVELEILLRIANGN